MAYEAENDQREAIHWCLRAAVAGDLSSLTRAARLLEQQGDFEQAEPYYRQAAEAGDVLPMLRLGNACEKRGSQREAIHWYRKAAEAGDSSGLVLAAMRLQARKKHRKAEALYREAADFGDPAAVAHLNWSRLRKEMNDQAIAQAIAFTSGRAPTPPAARSEDGSKLSGSDRAILWCTLGVLAILVGIGIHLTVRIGPETPTCEGETMGPGDDCIVISGNADSFSYEEFMAERAEKERRWADGPPPEAMLGYALIAGGVIVIGINGVRLAQKED